MYHKETGSSGAERKMGFLQGIKIWSYWTTVSFFCSLCLLSSSSSPRRHFSPTVILISAQEYDAVSLHHSDHPPSFKSNISVSMSLAYSSMTCNRSSFSISGQVLLRKNSSEYASCHNKKLLIRTSPDVRIRTSGFGW